MLGEYRLELAIALHKALDALRKRAALRIEVIAEELRDPLGDLAGALDEELAHRPEKALALPLEGLGIESAARLPQREHAQAKCALGVFVTPSRPFGKRRVSS